MERTGSLAGVNLHRARSLPEGPSPSTVQHYLQQYQPCGKSQAQRVYTPPLMLGRCTQVFSTPQRLRTRDELVGVRSRGDYFLLSRVSSSRTKWARHCGSSRNAW
jgi:hypothetical protein